MIIWLYLCCYVSGAILTGGFSKQPIKSKCEAWTNPRESVVWKPFSVGAGIAAAISAGLMYLETQQEIDYIWRSVPNSNFERCVQ